MNRNVIKAFVAAIAIVLVAIALNAYVLLALLIFIPILLWRAWKKKDVHDETVKLLSIDEAQALFGFPNNVIVADATRGNEAAGCILVFNDRRMLVVGGEPVRMEDIVDVSSVNTATPYTVGQYQVVLTTKRPDRQYIRIDVGMDGEMAKDVAMEVIDSIK